MQQKGRNMQHHTPRPPIMRITRNNLSSFTYQCFPDRRALPTGTCSSRNQMSAEKLEQVVHRDQRFTWQPTINSAPRRTVYMATDNKQCTAINGLHGNRQASRTNDQVHLTQSSVAATYHRTTSVSSFAGNEPQNFVPRTFFY